MIKAIPIMIGLLLAQLAFGQQQVPYRALQTDLDGSALAEVQALRPVQFNMKRGKKPNPDRANYARTQIGLIAEDVERVDPRLAVYEQDGKTPKSYRQESVIALLIKAVQEQQAEIDQLRAAR